MVLRLPRHNKRPECGAKIAEEYGAKIAEVQQEALVVLYSHIGVSCFDRMGVSNSATGAKIVGFGESGSMENNFTWTFGNYKFQLEIAQYTTAIR
jgi:hypothetical protein